MVFAAQMEDQHGVNEKAKAQVRMREGGSASVR